MGYQSSRILWHKEDKDSSGLSPVTIYDPNYVIYTKGNLVIYEGTPGSSNPSGISTDKAKSLYKCNVEEYGGTDITLEDDKWVLVKGIYEFTASKLYKKGARCIYGNYLYECKQSFAPYDPRVKIPSDYPEFWDIVKQPNAFSYELTDHKAVYYDDGKNKNKWHKMMYFIQDWYDKENNPISLYSDAQRTNYTQEQIDEGAIPKYEMQYFYGDEVLRAEDFNGQVVYRLYKCKVTGPVQGTWNPTYWEYENEVEYFTPFKTYNKDDKVIYHYGETVETNITMFDSELKYQIGQYVLDYINKDDALPNFETAYIDRILGKEKIPGCYILHETINAATSLDHAKADLMPYYLRSSPNSYTNTDEYIMAVPKDGHNYCLYHIDRSTNPHTVTLVKQFCQKESAYHVYSSLIDQTPSGFDRSKWIEKYNKSYTDIDLYGVIWELLGQPGGGSYPFYTPVCMINTLNGARCVISSLYYFPGNNCLEIGQMYDTITDSQDDRHFYCRGGFAGMIATNGVCMLGINIGTRFSKSMVRSDILICSFGKWGVASIPGAKMYADDWIIPSPGGFLFRDYSSNDCEIYKANVSGIGPNINSTSKIFANDEEPASHTTNTVYYVGNYAGSVNHCINGFARGITRYKYFISNLKPNGQILDLYECYCYLKHDGTKLPIGSDSHLNSVANTFYTPGLEYDEVDSFYLNQEIGEDLYYSIDEDNDPPSNYRVLVSLQCSTFGWRSVEEEVSIYGQTHTIMYVYRKLYKYETYGKTLCAEFSDLLGNTLRVIHLRTYTDAINRQVTLLWTLTTVSGLDHTCFELANSQQTYNIGEVPEITDIEFIWANDAVAYIFVYCSESYGGLYKVRFVGSGLFMQPTLEKVNTYTKSSFVYPYSFIGSNAYVYAYNKEPIHISIGSYYANISKILLHQDDTFQYARFVCRDIEGEEDIADVYINFSLFIHHPYCSTGSSNPGQSPNGLYGGIPTTMSIKNSGIAFWSSLGLCLPGFPDDTQFLNAFFWLSGTCVQGHEIYTFDVTPAYGGPEENGFWEGEEEMLLEYTGGQGETTQEPVSSEPNT